MYYVNGSTKNPLRHSLTALLNTFKDMEFNKPLYCFTLPGFVLSAGGLYMGLSFLQTFYLGGSLKFGPTILMVLLTFVGIGMAFTGILLHSISGLFRHLKE